MPICMLSGTSICQSMQIWAQVEFPCFNYVNISRQSKFKLNKLIEKERRGKLQSRSLVAKSLCWWSFWFVTFCYCPGKMCHTLLSLFLETTWKRKVTENEEVSGWKTQIKEHTGLFNQKIMYIHILLTDKDICECQNILIFHVLFYLCLSSWIPLQFFDRFSLLFLFLCSPYFKFTFQVFLQYYG